MQAPDSKLTRIGVFYDGGYFSAVSNYYRYVHDRKARLDVKGIHQFVCDRVAKAEETNERHCRVVDAHYFRGRYSISAAIERNKLEHERRFDDVLMRAGVVTHYLPRGAKGEEKGIDVWFALEAFELAVYKRFNVLALIACDGDYVPLIRKLNTLGTRVMLLAWDFKYVDNSGEERETRTSEALIKECTYPLMMHDIIDDRSLRKNPFVDGLFYVPSPRSPDVTGEPVGGHSTADGDLHTGRIKDVYGDRGFGFIADGNTNEDIFFFHANVLDNQFGNLASDDSVEFRLAPSIKSDDSMQAVDVRKS